LSILEKIGNTPVVRVEIDGVEVFLKLEMFNPGGSIKDRPALSMIETAERLGVLNPSKVVVEATSGNTGIGLALVSAVKGYRCMIVMPEDVSEERKQILKSFGSEVYLTSSSKGMKGAVEFVENLISENPEKYFCPRQFDNPENPKVHYLRTSVEILSQVGFLPMLFAVGYGTGGTFSGVARRFKEVNENCLCVVVEPEGCSVPGVAPGFKPKNLEESLIDMTVKVDWDEVVYYTKLLSQKFGILAGPSSGMNLAGSLKASKLTGIKEKVVTILPDTGERYLSLGLWK